MNCLLCESSNIISRPTVISDFISARIFGEDMDKMDLSVNLCHCCDCGFSFYDKRFTDEEMDKVYNDYRGHEYQRERQKYDVWYTQKVNNAMNNDNLALSEQKRVINKMIADHITEELKVALDYGGNQGKTFTEKIGTQEKYVYDVSGAETLPGIDRIEKYEKISEHDFDFIMCNMTLEHVADPRGFIKLLYNIGSPKTYYYLEVPSENPFAKNKFSISKNIKLLFNPVFSNKLLIKHYMNLRKKPYMPMSEHINFFTPHCIRLFLDNEGFNVIDVRESKENGVLGENYVLSALFRKRETSE